jgi:hypothetical protein
MADASTGGTFPKVEKSVDVSCAFMVPILSEADNGHQSTVATTRLAQSNARVDADHVQARRE